MSRATLLGVLILIWGICSCGDKSSGPDNSEPIADAGEDVTAQTGQLSKLDGSGSSDADGDSLSFVWRELKVNPVSGLLPDSTATSPTFTPDVPGTYLFTLIVTDGQASSPPDTVVVAVTQANRVPIADAEADEFGAVDESAMLSGSGSYDVDGETWTYTWRELDTNPVAGLLSDPAAESPTFTPSEPGIYRFTLVVDDGEASSLPDTVAVVVTTRPVARIRTDELGWLDHLSQLDGSGSSDADDDPLAYRWRELDDNPATGLLSDPTAATPSFLPTETGNYRFTLVVSDGKLSSVPQEILIEVRSTDVRVTLPFDKGARLEVGDLLIEPVSELFVLPIGGIHLPGQEIPPVTFSIEQILGVDGDIADGVELPVLPEVDIDVSVDIPLEGVDQMVIREGGLEVAVLNELPMFLENLTLTLRDDEATVGRIDLGSIPDFDYAFGWFDFSGASISNELSMTVVGKSVEAQNVYLDADHRLQIESLLFPVIADEVTGLIPQQEFSGSRAVRITDSALLTERASVREGELVLRVMNDLPLTTNVVLDLKELRTSIRAGTAVTISDLAPGESREVTIDLTDSELTPANPEEIRLSYTAQTYETAEPLTLIADAGISVEVVAEGLTLSLFQGKIDRLALPPAMSERSVDFRGPEGSEYDSTSLELFLTSTIGFAGEAVLRIEGTTDDDQSKAVTIRGQFDAGDANTPAAVSVVSDSQELKDLVNFRPTWMAVESIVSIGASQETAVIQPTDWIRVDSLVIEAAQNLP